MCGKHYQRWRKHGDPLWQRPVVVGVAECSVDGCASIVQARGWCSAHWSRWQRHGSPTARLRGEVVDGKRVCPTCDVDKPLAQWTKGQCRPCAAERTRTNRIRTPAPSVAWACRRCGIPFLGDKKNRTYCSRDCAESDRNRANWKHVAIRRARERAAFVERFDRAEVFERDGWMCQICGLPVDRTASHPSPLSASLDHIIPVSRGGAHSRENAQCTHLGCNVRKGARMP